jgi:two-component system, LytTR family, response regulator
MTNVVICEDEPLARETLVDFLGRWPQLSLLGQAADGLEAVRLIELHKPDLVFRDIQMPELWGLEALARVQHEPALIFTTAYDQHAVAAFELRAVDYLLKPFSCERFDTAVQRALDDQGRDHAADREALAERKQLRHGDAPLPLGRILVRKRGRIFPLPIDRIEYLRADNKYTLITAAARTHVANFGLNELEARTDGARFLRVHRSAIVNMEFVPLLVPQDNGQLEVQMQDGTRIMANREVSRPLRGMAL